MTRPEAIQKTLLRWEKIIWNLDHCKRWDDGIVKICPLCEYLRSSLSCDKCVYYETFKNTCQEIDNAFDVFMESETIKDQSCTAIDIWAWLGRLEEGEK